MYINSHLLALDVWDLPWHQIVAKLVIYSITLHFLIIPAMIRLRTIFRDFDR